VRRISAIHFSIMLLVFAVSPAKGDEPLNTVPGDVASVVSIESWKEKELVTNVTPYYRYRAIYHEPIRGEAMPWLEIQKLTAPSFGAKEVLFSFRVDVLTHPVTNEAFGKLCGENNEQQSSCEAQYGCCGIFDIKWGGLALNYSIGVGEKTYSCVAPDIKDNKPTTKCWIPSPKYTPTRYRP